ncbi:fimbria/pilus outer membrane usher protein [Pantoea sp. 1.19]|uniref:fimbria/pilus outer membrane usher protein n=1 Tax=Pantoea sp. 1.19 TaxID=1925589 RepID=UPI000A5BC204|nr:fimbria/pilus outer membrane usher protein [Pantoea sp. 1.19]
MRGRVLLTSLSLAASAPLLLPVAARSETYSSLPPPPSASSAQDKQQYLLDLQVNGRVKNQLVTVTFRDGHYLVRAADLIQAGIPSSQITSTEMDVSTMPDVRAEYDSRGQRLLLSVPPAWLPAQHFAGESDKIRYPGNTSRGALLNYDLYASNTRSSSRLSLWNELRLFGDSGQLVTNGVWQHTLRGNDNTAGDRWLRYDSWWAGQDETRAIGWRVGDLISDALAWNNSVRLGGVQISRDFSIRPDIVTWPLPGFSGQAALPSTVDLFIDGYRNTRTAVQPGPWSLTNLPFVNGAGNAVVVTTDAVGRQVTTTLPFYVASDLLKPGLNDFAFSAGALRENYGLRSADYGEVATTVSWRHGLLEWLTLESHAETAQSLALAGGGVQLRAGALGVVNGALARSQLAGSSGQQLSVGYQYQHPGFSVGAQHIQRSVSYGDLALYAARRAAPRQAENATLSRRSTTLNGSVSLQRFGSLGAAWIDVTGGEGDRTQLLNLTWSNSVWGNSTLYLSATRDRTRDNWSGSLSLIVPLGSLSNLSASLERTAEGQQAQRLAWSRAMPSDGGVAWDASWGPPAAAS